MTDPFLAGLRSTRAGLESASASTGPPSFDDRIRADIAETLAAQEVHR